jgi:outer membrane protein assembly factor BamD
MPIFKLSYLIIIFVVCISCSKEVVKNSVIIEKNIESQMIEAYDEGLKALKNGDVLFAAKKFNEAEILYPQSQAAPKAAIMAAYSYYSQDYYGDAIAELKRFFRVYPNHKNTDYVEYMLALSYYEQIVDEKKDLQSINNAKNSFLNIIKKYPDTDYAEDALFKIDLINDILAAKEIYIGRYYFDKKKWIAAINRFREVVDNYDTTIYIEEALHRLVEIHYIIGLENEAKKYASLLAYNYQSSEWYAKTYSIFDKLYEQNNLEKEKKKGNFFLNKFKSLFE